MLWQPWKLPGDMKHFQKITMATPATAAEDAQNAVVMGRKTWESIPAKFRPLKGRINVVLTRSAANNSNDDDGETKKLSFPEGVIVASSLQDAMAQLETTTKTVGEVFVIGGSQIYEQAVKSGLVNKVICTNVYGLAETTKFDAFFPELTEAEWECRPFGADATTAVDDKENTNANNDNAPQRYSDEKSGLTYEFLEYSRKNSVAAQVDTATTTVVNKEEMQYLDLCREILESGIQRGDRTGTGTLSKFGTQMRFSLRDGTLPLLTTKRTFWRGVAEELLWFVAVSFHFR